jgi:hypothetical protein
MLAGCGDSGTNPEPLPPVPHFVTAVSDTATIEQGIDAIPEEDAIFLQWHRDEALAGFQLFRRSEGEKSFAMIATLTARDSIYYDRISPNLRCYYYLRGVADDERLSAASDTVDYMLLAKATDLAVNDGDPLLFSWSVGLMRPASYVLRLQEENSGAPVWISRIQPGYQGTQESAAYNFDGRARLQRLKSGVRYRWRLDCVGAAPRSGSESAWQGFSLF